MRPLLILCEPHHVGAVSEGVRLHSHPAVRESFVGIIGVTTDGDPQTMRYQQAQALAWLNAPHVGATDVALVAATKEVVGALRLRAFAKAAGFELKETTAHALTRRKTRAAPVRFRGC